VVSVISSLITPEILLFSWFIYNPANITHHKESYCKVTDELQTGKDLEGVVTAYYDDWRDQKEKP
jgi:hypothetical protein